MMKVVISRNMKGNLFEMDIFSICMKSEYTLKFDKLMLVMIFYIIILTILIYKYSRMNFFSL